MNYEMRGNSADGKPFVRYDEGLPAAVEFAIRSIMEENCRDVNIYDPAASGTVPVMSYQQLLDEIDRRLGT